MAIRVAGRVTGTLKCSVCGSATRHAILRDACGEFRDFAELAEHEQDRQIIAALAGHERRRAMIAVAREATEDELRQEALYRIKRDPDGASRGGLGAQGLLQPAGSARADDRQARGRTHRTVASAECGDGLVLRRSRLLS
jgi:hypothetical protein